MLMFPLLPKHDLIIFRLPMFWNGSRIQFNLATPMTISTQNRLVSARDKTMDEQLMYTHNYIKQIYPYYKLTLVEKFRHRKFVKIHLKCAQRMGDKGIKLNAINH